MQEEKHVGDEKMSLQLISGMNCHITGYIYADS